MRSSRAVAPAALPLPPGPARRGDAGRAGDQPVGDRARGLRGPVGSFLFMNLRLLNDQTLENATGVGAPPWTWPVDEQVIDLLHKAIYAFAACAVADWMIAGPPGVPAPRRLWRQR